MRPENIPQAAIAASVVRQLETSPVDDAVLAQVRDLIVDLVATVTRQAGELSATREAMARLTERAVAAEEALGKQEVASLHLPDCLGCGQVPADSLPVRGALLPAEEARQHG